MIGRWIRGLLGVYDLVEELRAERAGQRELIAQMARTSEVQAQAVTSMVEVIERIYRSYETDGSPPQERHITEEIEDKMLDGLFYGSDESE